MRFVPLLAAALLASSAAAQAPQPGATNQPPAPLPGTSDPAKVAAGTYAIDPTHTQVIFAVDHMGFSIFRGFLSEASGTLTLDPAKLTATQLSVTIPIASIHTPVDKLNAELVSPDWFDAQRFPTATFVSTKVTPGPNGLAMIT